MTLSFSITQNLHTEKRLCKYYVIHKILRIDFVWLGRTITVQKQNKE